MARIESLNILTTPSGKDYLAELYGKVIDNVSKEAVSTKIKNSELSGDPTSGSVEAKRFANAASSAYGTARAAGKGAGIKASPVVIQINQDKEIVEEVENKDIKLYGVDGLLEKRANSHVKSMVSELDTAFFADAVSEGTALTLEGTAIEDQIEEAIQAIETVKNDYVDGVPRSMINLTCTPKIYGKIRTYLDKVTVPNINSAEEEFNEYHGVKTFSSVHLPAGVEFVVMTDGAIAQPVTSDTYKAEKIPLSNAYGVSLFYSYGTKATAPDLIAYKEAETETDSVDDTDNG